MQDRPTFDELLEAIERWLDEQVVARGEGALRYQGRVAANVIRIVRRELAHEDAQLAREWQNLDALLGASERPADRTALRDALAARNETLCARVRAGEADEGSFRDALLSHLRETVRDKLTVTNPAWLKH